MKNVNKEVFSLKPLISIEDLKILVLLYEKEKFTRRQSDDGFLFNGETNPKEVTLKLPARSSL